MGTKLSNKLVKKFLIIIGLLLSFVLIIGLYFLYTMFRVGQVLEKENMIDPINMKYQILETVAAGSTSDPRSQYSKDKLDSYTHSLKTLCISQNIHDSECNLKKLKLENLQTLDDELSISIKGLVELDSKL